MDEWLAGAERAFETAQDAGAMPSAEHLLQMANIQAQISIAHTLAEIRDLIVLSDMEALDGDS